MILCRNGDPRGGAPKQKRLNPGIVGIAILTSFEWRSPGGSTKTEKAESRHRWDCHSHFVRMAIPGGGSTKTEKAESRHRWDCHSHFVRMAIPGGGAPKQKRLNPGIVGIAILTSFEWRSPGGSTKTEKAESRHRWDCHSHFVRMAIPGGGAPKQKRLNPGIVGIAILTSFEWRSPGGSTKTEKAESRHRWDCHSHFVRMAIPGGEHQNRKG